MHMPYGPAVLTPSCQRDERRAELGGAVDGEDHPVRPESAVARERAAGEVHDREPEQADDQAGHEEPVAVEEPFDVEG